MKIHVTEDHIRCGTRLQGDCCPVARAITEAGLKNVHVTYSGIWIDGDEKPIPPSVSEFVRLFDKGIPVEPFEFDLSMAQ